MEPTRGGAFKGVPPRLLYKLLLGSRLNNTDIVATINAMAARAGHEGFLSQQKAVFGRGDNRELLSTITCPTLVPCGRDDEMTPPCLSREIADQIPRVSLVMVEARRHLSHLVYPELTTGALKEWSQR